jgi:hypothetical protein
LSFPGRCTTGDDSFFSGGVLLAWPEGAAAGRRTARNRCLILGKNAVEGKTPG